LSGKWLLLFSCFGSHHEILPERLGVNRASRTFLPAFRQIAFILAPNRQAARNLIHNSKFRIILGFLCAGCYAHHVPKASPADTWFSRLTC
jgi:hypothetical protein